MKYNQCPHISAVIPVCNEAQNLYYILPRIPSFVSEVILVDRHSTNDSVAVARQLMPEIRIIKQRGQGRGDAVRSGLAACSGDIVVMLNGDGSTDPQEIAQFVEVLIEGSDFAKGSRFLQHGGCRDIPLLRRLGNKALCTLLNRLFGVRFSDLCSGYIAFWRYCLNYVEFDGKGFETGIQLCLRILKAYMNIVEVPYVEQTHMYGQNNLHMFYDGWRVLKTILKERWIGIPWSSQAHSLVSPYGIVEPAAHETAREPESERDFPLLKKRSI